MQVTIDKMSDALQRTPYFDRLLALCPNSEIYLAGGAVRDLLIGQQVKDLDFISPQDPTPLARNFARKINGSWFWLDQQRRQSRVVVNHNKNCPNYDFALFRAATLEQDLFDRDYTINAMALPLKDALSVSAVIDPCHGLNDLRHDILRMVSLDALANDPLRIIKGVRHATALGLKIETETLKCMRRQIAGLCDVASERIRQEFWKILSDPQADRGLTLLAECGAGEQLFGTDFCRFRPVLSALLVRCRRQWTQLAINHPYVHTWLQQDIEQGLSVEVLLLFIFLMDVMEKDLPLRLAGLWKLSRKAIVNIMAVSKIDDSVIKDFSSIACNQRAYFWWSSRLSADPKLLLLALAAHSAAGVISAKVDELTPLTEKLEKHRIIDLVGGEWLQDELGLNEGPIMTKALNLLRNAEIYGEVNSRKEARLFLASHFQNRD